jgi:hypothetical protein
MVRRRFRSGTKSSISWVAGSLSFFAEVATFQTVPVGTLDHAAAAPERLRDRR